MFDPGFDIRPRAQPLGFEWGDHTFGPELELRSLDAIRASLKEPDCTGPDPVYAIAMDVGKPAHLPLLQDMHLLYGAVTYAAGSLGSEPVRSQGHIHAVSPNSGWSTPEIYEIWQGTAIIYMQEHAADQPGRCFAVRAESGEVVIVPPNWAHATISADPTTPLAFGAWCDRAYAFEYAELRKRGGIAWFPHIQAGGLDWQANDAYTPSRLIHKGPQDYQAFNLVPGRPIYTQFEDDPERFRFVPEPAIYEELWKTFSP